MAACSLDFKDLRNAYNTGLTPSEVIERLYPRLTSEHGMFNFLLPLKDLLSRCRAIESSQPDTRGPLYGIPFGVKDNIDVAGLPTTASCEAFRYIPAESAPVVQVLLDAGGVMVGKTNLDQFAAGLVGTRTPYGTARNPFDDRFIPGGSSSGSGAAVGGGLLSFALGTDTAGSGRVPGHFCGCVGIKPTVGRFSTTGVVPACRSLDCPSVFARCVEDGAEVARLMQEAGRRVEDRNWRTRPVSLPSFGSTAALSSKGPVTPEQSPVTHSGAPRSPTANGHSAPRFKFGVPSAKFLSFAGPGGDDFARGYERLYKEACERLQEQGGEPVSIDFAPFATAAGMLYTSAFLAERYAGIRAFLESKGKNVSRDTLASDSRMERVTAAILSGAPQYSAADAFDAFTQLNELRAAARVEMARVDFLVVPSAAHHYTVAEIEADEKTASTASWAKNGNLGRFTNFVNLMDMAAIAIPSGILRCQPIAAEATGEVAQRAQHLAATGNPAPVLPFGVTLIGPAWSDDALWEVAAAFHADTGLGCGPEGHGVQPYRHKASSQS
ncbi:hypothetical protein CVIRNUC_010282 [Coccomyxa viridis]|uniref:Amidase domain-containing protein n=1 Tax=Coccomyxa viridis TaxID=1274662 RepID=A0AAV1IIA8_9CHLO|nr:hypothetical protein CVIRNUC_010282 [Coccomyxa viridis]